MDSPKLRAKAEQLALDIVEDIKKQIKKGELEPNKIPELLRRRADWIQEILTEIGVDTNKTEER